MVAFESPESIAMESTWRLLKPVAAYRAALRRFLWEELDLPGGGGESPVDLLSMANALCCEFDSIWAHRVPTRGDLVLADRAGRLEEVIAELNAEFDASNK